ncbi:MAG TPA: helix-turn-helix transcriptional regulator [Candidatus Binatia bacterium]|nr:helix-turn-helix transcriptional regulator [Candidatus Binatia bacterium]
MNSSYTKQQQAYLKKVGQQIRKARLEKSFSQEKFAQVCKLDRTYISDVERGERNISILNLKKITDNLQISIPQLLLNDNL